jgi:hypothetical protein
MRFSGFSGSKCDTVDRCIQDDISRRIEPVFGAFNLGEGMQSLQSNSALAHDLKNTAAMAVRIFLK